MTKIINWLKTEYPKTLQYVVTVATSAIITYGESTHWRFFF